MKTQFLIAAPTSGAGKTTVARGLMALFRQQGCSVQPFKCGPDYIDTKFHERVCGRPSVNLDTFMASPDDVRQTFAYYSQTADVTIVEGMMGAFDGYDRDRGSSAEIARLLSLPVVMVVNARSAAYSMAPLLWGFKHYRPDVSVAGVIFNQVSSPRHRDMLRQVCADLHLQCFGFVPKHESLEQQSRYLGLDFSVEAETDVLTSLLREHVDHEALRQLCAQKPLELDAQWMERRRQPWQGKTVWVARNDEAFSFIYHAQTDVYDHPHYFDPFVATSLPDQLDLLYLPGGYPEKHLEALSRNEPLRRAIADYARRGGHIVAECGGMMYLCDQIVSDEGTFPMCGVLPYTVTARRQDRRLSLGYRRFVLDGREYRGHEFHYTRFLDPQPTSACPVFNAAGQEVGTPVIRQGNVWASYIHMGAPLNPPEGGTLFLPPSRGLKGAIMLAGTGSDVGKSIIATALCRIFKQDGYRPAPFKAQNMALNSYATPDGLEIGRAQAVQAEAAGIAPTTDMNPLLLKPQSDHTSQVVLHGRPMGNKSAYDYWRHREQFDSLNSQLRREVCGAFDRLAAAYSPIVMEGAGSISEINLRQTDLVNMPMARYARAAVILVADIDRGGVFASVCGSIALQTPEDRRLIKGIIINKFRGDLRLFDEGRRLLEELTGVPVLGVVPYFSNIHIEEEDSVALTKKSMMAQRGKVNVAVVMLRHLSNYTDFDALEHDARVHLYYTNNVDEVQKADIIILPGTKSTLDDLMELRRNGVAQAVMRAHRRGATVLGICGGYQMMGLEVCDPNHVEGDIERLPGLGLLPTTTTMSGEKLTRQTEFTFIGYPSADGQHPPMRGYEIHMGTTRPYGDAKASPLARLGDGRSDGYVVSERCMGTYLHGILDNQAMIERLLSPFADRLKEASEPFDYQLFKQQQYDLLADHVRRHVDMDRLYAILNATEP